jgi:excinuclease ABC subunit C
MQYVVGDEFTTFGPSAFLPRRPTVASLEAISDRRAVRRALRASCPNAAGVYGMIDFAGRLVYVGKSAHLRKRLLTYFQGALPQEARLRRTRDDESGKELRIARRAKRIVWEVAGHELLALLREHELIRRFAPDLNVRGRRRRLAYVYLSNEDAPRFRIASQLPQACRHHWGPFSHNGHLIRSVELLNRQFKLPDCPSETIVRFSDDGQLFPIVDRPLCLRGEVDRCLAPCAGLAPRSDYFAQLARARAFLDGEDDTPLAELDAGIAGAIERRQFEHAARLHEIQSDLETLRDRLLPRPHEEPRSFVYPLARGRRNTWMLVHRGAVLAVRREPVGDSARRFWLNRLDAIPCAEATSVDDRDATESRIVHAWFRRHPTELERVLSYAAARDFCRQFRRA